MRRHRLLTLTAVAAAIVALMLAPAPRAGHAALQQPPLVAQPPVVVPGGPGRWDYMQVDLPLNRLLAAHTGKDALAVMDLATGALRQQVATGRAQGVAVAGGGRGGKYFVSVSREQKVVVLDRRTLAKRKEIPLSGPADAITYDPRIGRAYVCHDDGTHLWVIDGDSEQIVATIDIPEGPEYVLYDSDTDTLFQNIAGNNTVLSIDPASSKIVKRWPTDPATTPHGLAVDGKTHRLFTAGSNGKLAVLDFAAGKRVATVDIAPRVDQIVFDPGRKRVYCACRGAVSVVEETADGARSLGNVPVPAGAHTIAVDPRTHNVWICYADDKESYVMKLVPAETK